MIYRYFNLKKYIQQFIISNLIKHRTELSKPNILTFKLNKDIFLIRCLDRSINMYLFKIKMKYLILLK